MKTILTPDQFDLAAEKKAADKDGKVREYVIDEDGAMTPLTIAPQVRLSVGQLRSLCASSSGPLAVQKAKSVRGLREDQIVVILKQDYDALKTGARSQEPGDSKKKS